MLHYQLEEIKGRLRKNKIKTDKIWQAGRLDFYQKDVKLF